MPSSPLLTTLAQKMQKTSLSALFAQDPARVENFSLTVDQLYLDYSKNFLTTEVMNALLAMAETAQVPQAIHHLLTGEKINTTEQKPALHTALRHPPEESLWVDGTDVVAAIHAQREKMATMVQAIREKKMGGGDRKTYHRCG